MLNRLNREDGIVFEESSGNVFADLGFPDAEERLNKADLSYEIFKIISSRKLTQRDAARLLGISQPKVSKIVRGDLNGFSFEKLMDLGRKLGVEYRVVKTAPAQTYTSFLPGKNSEMPSLPEGIASLFLIALAVSLSSPDFSSIKETTFQSSQKFSTRNRERISDDQSPIAA